MYQVYADQILIYDDESQRAEHKLVNPKLSLADSSAGSFTMTVPPGNAGYDTIERMKTDIIVMKEGEILWQGRVLQENVDFWNQRVLTCEGELAFLNDTIQPPHVYDYNNQEAVRLFLSALLTEHNNKVEANRQFTLGAVTVYAPNNILYRETNYEKTISCVNEKLVSKLGGHLIVRHQNGARYLDYLEENYNLNTQTVNFGKNLIDFTRSFDSEEYATVIVPLGKRLEKEEGDPDLEKYLTVESVNGGSIYVGSVEAVGSYGWIVKVVHFDDVEDPNTLLQMGQDYVSSLQYDSMVIELSALDLHYLNPDIEQVKLGDSIRVISEPHGLDRIFPVQKMEIPLDKPENTTFTLGTEVRLSLTSENNKVNTELKEKIENIETTQSEIDPDAILTQAQQNAAALMGMTLNGYVTLETSETGGKHSEALYISDEKPLRNANNSYHAQRFWRWNINGLGYSDDYGNSWKSAMLMDGTILGERIAAGSIHASKLTTQSLSLVTSQNGDNACMIYLKAKGLSGDELAVGSIDTSSGTNVSSVYYARTIKKHYLAINQKVKVTGYTYTLYRYSNDTSPTSGFVQTYGPFSSDSEYTIGNSGYYRIVVGNGNQLRESDLTNVAVRITLGTETSISSANITIAGMVTFEQLSNSGTTDPGGSKTFIDGGHIRADTIDTTNLRVRNVYYYDPNDSINYKIVASETEGAGYPTYIYIGPKDRDYDASNFLYLYGNNICFGEPGDGSDLTHLAGSLEFDMRNHTIRHHSNNAWMAWNLGDDEYPFLTVCATEVHFANGILTSTSYGLRYRSDGVDYEIVMREA